MTRADYVVVGGGIYGAAITWALAEQGATTTLVERRHVASGPTSWSSANVRLLYVNPHLQDLCLRSLRIFQAFADRIPGGDAGFQRIGCGYTIAAQDAEMFSGAIERMRSDGYPVQAMSERRFADQYPGVDLSGVALCVYEPESGYADPAGTANALVSRARDLGATVMQNTPIERVRIDDRGASGVVTAGGDLISANRAVVLAAGPWTGALTASVGYRVPTWPERHAVIFLSAPGARRVVPSILDDWVLDFYCRPEGEDLILVGDNLSPPPLADPDEPTPLVPTAEETERVLARLIQRLPGLASAGIRPGYASVYDVSPDSLHIVDWVPAVPRLFLACGTSGHGFKMAMAIAEQVAARLLGGDAPDLAPFGLDRRFTTSSERVLKPAQNAEPHLARRRGAQALAAHLTTETE